MSNNFSIEDLFGKCLKAQAEVRINGLICTGLVDTFSKVETISDDTFVLRLKSVIQRKTPQSEKEELECREFVVILKKKPIVIKDGEYDCIHFCFEAGYMMVVYFLKPLTHRTWD